MTFLAEGTSEVLSTEGDIVLSRVRPADGSKSFLMLASADEKNSSAFLERIEHEYHLADELDPAWSIRPLSLERHSGHIVLILEDPGGRPLIGELAQPVEVARFLRLAIGIAAALGEMHRRGFVHKDIKPANVFVDASDHIRLSGFGIASRLPREHQAPISPDAIAGTLAYMAPEQTGCFNRSIDSRSDLYSLGITLYQMLTGALPFTARSPSEWVHCHIARQPMPPSQGLTTPKQLALIVMKLLEKSPEDRYQTAGGVEKDLSRCLAEWEAHDFIDAFPLGKQDISDRLLIPEKLYGRERDIETLLEAFGRVAADGNLELVIISGESGIGKSSMVTEIYKSVVSAGAIFASGKFDEQKRDIPYATLIQAFQGVVGEVLGKNASELVRWRRKFLDALGQDSQLLVSMIPELALIVGEQQAPSDLTAHDARSRFQETLRRFLGVFAQPDHPLVLFIDDLQWLDAGTLELLRRLVDEEDVRHLLLIGAYRDSDVSLSHPLMRTLAAIRNSGVALKEVKLQTLALNDLTKLVADTVRCEPKDALLLAKVVLERTGGNPLFAVQLIAALGEEGLLGFDPVKISWNWDLEEIEGKYFTDNVLDLVAGKLSRLPKETQNALAALACLGHTADVNALALVYGRPEYLVHAVLRDAVHTGLVVHRNNTYEFRHDRFQEAAYALTPEENRAAAHYRAGQLLSSHTAPHQIEESIFEIVNQYNAGAELITTQTECEQVAQLNLIAGQRAMKSTAYVSALTFLTAGRRLLKDASWEQQYALMFRLESCGAECQLLTGAFGAAEERLLMLSSRAQNLLDHSRVARLLVSLYTTLNLIDRAVEACLEYLRRVGIYWVATPTIDEVQQEYDRIWHQIGSRSIEELVTLTPMTDPVSCAILEVLMSIAPTGVLTDKNLHCLVIGRMVNLSLRQGNDDVSCIAYVLLAMVLRSHFGDHDSYFRFGKLGLDLVESGLDRYKARVHLEFATVVNPWVRHVATGLPLLRSAFDTARRSGDLTFAAYSRYNLVNHLLVAGRELGEIRREAEDGIRFARKSQFTIVSDVMTGQHRLIQTLQGLSEGPYLLSEPEFDEASFERRLNEDARLACSYWIFKLQACYFADDCVSALSAAMKAQSLLWESPEGFGRVKLWARLSHGIELAQLHFYGALIRAACCDTASADQRPQHWDILTAHYNQLKNWAESCAENFGGRAALVAAEMARMGGHMLDAERHYEEAILAARERDFIQDEGLSSELAGRFFAARGLETIADNYLRNARNCYLRWGAVSKVKQLDQRYPLLREERRLPSRTPTIGTTVTQLDLQAMLNASQTLSSEIVLGTLIETLMKIAIEHAGAERGMLILLRNDEFRIEAEAKVRFNSISVAHRQAVALPTEVPETLLHSVIRTNQSIILEGAHRSNPFAGDVYFERRQSRSVLCMPLLKQARLIGLLYMENNLASGVFTPQRTAVLEFLTSQAAISLENAFLYDELTNQTNQRAIAEESLRLASSKLDRVSRLTAMGELAASIAHEISQPLASIEMNAEASIISLNKDQPDLIKARSALLRLLQNSRRAADVIRGLRTLALKSGPEIVIFDINEAIREVLEITRRELDKAKVQWRQILPSDGCQVLGDKVQLQQVLINLIKNGVEAMSSVTDGPKVLTISSELTDDGAVMVSVADGGIGLDPTVSDHVFDPLVTTKSDGMGMGLSICRTIIEAHGGRIWASPVEPNGTVFRFTLRRGREK